MIKIDVIEYGGILCGPVYWIMVCSEVVFLASLAFDKESSQFSNTKHRAKTIQAWIRLGKAFFPLPAAFFVAFLAFDAWFHNYLHSGTNQETFLSLQKDYLLIEKDHPCEGFSFLS